jgi:ubiquitin carboxyl-terminal hydrolase 7
MLGVQYYPHLMNTLFYEVLPMSIREYESKTYVRLSYIDSNTKEQGPFDLFVLKESKLAQVTQELLKCVKREENGSGRLRILEVINHKIYKTCDLSEPLESIPRHSSIYVEVIL